MSNFELVVVGNNFEPVEKKVVPVGHVSPVGSLCDSVQNRSWWGKKGNAANQIQQVPTE
jgi:hypothetical protein